MDDRGLQIPAPKSWAAFEDLCLSLFRSVWRDPLAQKNGRSGQPQHGVDVFGSPGGGYADYQGVQCKGKEQQYGGKVSVEELEREITKGDRFEPHLRHWILATTAPTDVELQEAARAISVTRAGEGKFTVSVLGWGDIESLLCEHRSVLASTYPGHGLDFSKLIDAVREQSEEVRGLLDVVAGMASATVRPRLAPRWTPVVFGQGRDLGPALMGRSLGPEDVAACPEMPEVEMVVADLERSFFARIVGEPGVGKSLCAYQVARRYADRGRHVLRLADSGNGPLALEPSDEASLSLYLIDDAHLVDPRVLEAAETSAKQGRMLLSVHNSIDDSARQRGCIAIDGKRAVGAVADALRSEPEVTLEVVRRVDDHVGESPGSTALDDRIDEAEREAQNPWQFCFILGGGWRRATQAADAARAAGADVVLAASAIHQLASRDARPEFDKILELAQRGECGLGRVRAAIGWLVQERLVLGPHDLRCPHQRFASAVLGKQLAAQDVDGQERIGRMLRHVVSDPTFPLAGLRVLLHELSFNSDNRRQWARLFRDDALAPLLDRCWGAGGPEERLFASLLLCELDAYVEAWPEELLAGHEDTIGTWITNPRMPSAHGLARLLHAVASKDRAYAARLMHSANPTVLARTVSAATPESAYQLGELTSGIRASADDAWVESFRSGLERSKLLELATNWRADGALWGFTKLCQAVNGVDEALSLDLVQAFVPCARQVLAADPIRAFDDLRDLAWHVLRVLDPLGVYKGRLAAKARHRRLARTMLQEIRPKKIAAQLSLAKLREFQSASMFLSFLAESAPGKFRATVAAMDWDRLGEAIGRSWQDLPHDAEVLLGVAYGATASRDILVDLIRRNSPRMDAFPPRLALMALPVAYEYVEKGGCIRLAHHGHIAWEFGAGLVACFARERPSLIGALLAPAEQPAGQVLSNLHPSWYDRAADFLGVVAEAAPDSTQRVLDAVDVSSAEVGWVAALRFGRGPRKTAAVLVETSLKRNDELGALASRLRSLFPSSSVPVS